MGMRNTFIIGFLIIAAGLEGRAVLWASDVPVKGTDASLGELLNEGAPAKDTEGSKSMAQIVDEAKKGFPTSFTDEEVMTLMSASHALKETDRPLAMKVEKIATKMSRHYSEKKQ